MAKQPARFDPESGAWVIEDGTPFQFLPEIPSSSPPYEFMGPAGSDPESPDGHRHYLIGGEPKVVDQIVAWYKSTGHPVPDGYAQAAADFAAAARKVEQDAAAAELTAAQATQATLEAAKPPIPARVEAAKTAVTKATERKARADKAAADASSKTPAAAPAAPAPAAPATQPDPGAAPPA